MKKILLSLYAFLFAIGLHAQIGAVAPDFTVVDINGDTVKLYEDILDKGLIAIVDVSTTWCAPCWSLHQSHALRELYEHHGPDGSDQLRVVFYEADPGTGLDDLNGTGTHTKGDWVTGTPYPIINENPLSLELAVWAPAGFPTVNIIDPTTKKIVADTWDKTSYDGQVTVIENSTGIDLINNTTGMITPANNKLTIYPNPASKVLYLEMDDLSNDATVTIFNLIGQAVLTQKIQSPSQALDVSHLKKGVYLVRTSNNGQETTARLVITQP